MRILIDINHPAHVHLFKEFAIIMADKNHDILFTSRKKDVAENLLKEFNFNFVSFGKHYKRLSKKVWGMLKFDYLLYRTAKRFDPDIFMSMSSIYAAQVSFIMRKPHIVFEDSEPVPEHQILCLPFSSTILTPYCLKKDFGKKQIRYHGYHELAYLHPNYFEPDSTVLSDSGINKGDKYAVLRFVSFKAGHDIGVRGFSLKDKINLVNELEKHGNVYISSECELPQELNKNRLVVSPGRLQHLLYYASLYLGDSQTMATEAAILGVPTIRCNSFAKSAKEMSNFIELEEKFQLIVNYNIQDKDKAIENAISFMKDNKLKEEWLNRRKYLLSQKIDVTKFMIWFIENYPGSVNEVNKSLRFFYKYISEE